jgi:hypothetical protein
MKKSSRVASGDGFIVKPSQPFEREHTLLTEYLADPKSATLPAESVKFEKSAQLALLCAAMERMEVQKQKAKINSALSDLIKKLAGRKLPYTEDALIWNVSRAASILMPKDTDNVQWDELQVPIPGVVPSLLDQADAAEKPLSKELLEALQKLHAAVKPVEFWAGNKKSVQRMEALLAQKPAGVPDDGEAWAEAIQSDIKRMSAARREHWQALLENAPKGTNARPTAKWRKEADELLAAVGTEEFAQQIEIWFGLVGVKAKDRIQSRNATLLRSLIWYASLLTGETVCRALANATEGGLRKLSAGGLYASSISKACIAALESMPGLEPLAQLSRLKHRVKSPWGLEEIEKAFANAVARSNVSRAEVEEISLPAFGLNQDGVMDQSIGEFTAELRIVGTHEVALTWHDKSGKLLPQKPSLPKTLVAEEKALKQLASDIEKMLSAQRDRVENFLERERCWSFADWRARYLEQPLMGQMTRRLIWQFNEGKQNASAMWDNGQFIQANGKAIDWVGSKTEVRLWHPMGVEATKVLAWRKWLEANGVTQPFKQAHREIYVLTGAELATRNYSNRFAAHILRQHQFKALCDQRGWRYEFLGSWDQPNMVATRDLTGWDLRAEFWIEHAATEYAPSGVALHVATDQVRFVRSDQSVRDLVDVPALVFSEVMRELDLFVSVCSAGNDPTWADGGDDRARNYWREWSFGELNATAATRRDILERLLPKLKIAGQCSLSDRYLVVRGQLRTYKIHLGSSNVLMEPNDLYLCIVADRKTVAIDPGTRVFLPFEGDHTLSVILSKAFLLAADSAIADESILRQIRS